MLPERATGAWAHKESDDEAFSPLFLVLIGTVKLLSAIVLCELLLLAADLLPLDPGSNNPWARLVLVRPLAAQDGNGYPKLETRWVFTLLGKGYGSISLHGFINGQKSRPKGFVGMSMGM